MKLFFILLMMTPSVFAKNIPNIETFEMAIEAGNFIVTAQKDIELELNDRGKLIFGDSENRCTIYGKYQQAINLSKGESLEISETRHRSLALKLGNLASLGCITKISETADYYCVRPKTEYQESLRINGYYTCLLKRLTPIKDVMSTTYKAMTELREINKVLKTKGLEIKHIK